MQPEIQKIQKKYQGKKDQDSMMKMQEETQAVYQKYGVSATGSCVQLAIQMPILFALYQVIQNIPAYVGSVYNVFNGVCTKILAVDGFTDIINNFITDNKMTRVRQVTGECRFYRRFPVCAVSVSVGILTEYQPVLADFQIRSARLLLKSRKCRHLVC